MSFVQEFKGSGIWNGHHGCEDMKQEVKWCEIARFSFLWNHDVSLEPIFCLIDLLRLVMKLNNFRKIYAYG
jgi:hypothetical protein